MKLRVSFPWIVLVLVLLSGCAGEPKYGTTSPEAIRSYEDGLTQLEKFYYPEAKVLFERALEEDSTFAIAWVRLAQIHFRTGNSSEAKEAIGRALQYSRLATRREGFYIRLWDYFVSYSVKDAAAVADSLIALYPDDKEAYLIRGTLFELEKRYDEAIHSYEHAVKLDTSYAIAVMSLGYVYSTAGKQVEALDYMQRYIRLAPDAADPRASYGDLLFRVGRYEEALDQYRASLRLKPDYWYATQQTGRVYAVLGRLREAEAELRKALRLLPPSNHIESSLKAVTAGFEMDRAHYQQAVILYQQALELDTINLSAAYGLCNAFIQLKRFDAAELVLARIMEEMRKRKIEEALYMLDIHLHRSRMLTEQLELEAALSECDSALQYSTLLTRPYVYRQMAEINLRRRDYESAISACEGALAVNLNSPHALLTLTRIYQAKGDRRMTAEIGNRLRALWRDADSDYRYLIELRRLLGRSPTV